MSLKNQYNAYHIITRLKLFCVCGFVLDFFKKFFTLFFWLRRVFVASHGLSLVVASRGYSLLQCVGFSLRWLLVAEHGL